MSTPRSKSPITVEPPTKSTKKPTTVINCMMTPSYSTPYSPYAVVSPVLVPYVQAPVQYIKNNKTKNVPARLPSSPVKVRYVPAYSYTPMQPQYICYNKQCLSQTATDGGAQALSQRLGIPFAMRINPDARRLNQGYVSALTPPAAYLVSPDSDLLSRSELNPLSRPYTPSNRVKQCTCAHRNTDSDGESSRQETSTPLSDTFCSECDCMSSNSRSPLSSRSSTPKWPLKSGSDLSDTDSGVDGECDDDELGDVEDDCYSCDIAAAEKLETVPTAAFERLDSVSDLELKYSDEIRDSLPSELITIVDFLCLHLDSHEWRTVAREMGVNDVLIQSVEYDFYDSFRDQMKLVFTHWANLRKSEEHSSSSELVTTALTEIGRVDLIELLNASSNN